MVQVAPCHSSPNGTYTVVFMRYRGGLLNSKSDEVHLLISPHDTLVAHTVKIDVPRFVVCSCEKRTLLKRHVDDGGTIAASVQSLHRRKLATHRASTSTTWLVLLLSCLAVLWSQLFWSLSRYAAGSW